jgi:hypothetical protein
VSGLPFLVVTALLGWSLSAASLDPYPSPEARVQQVRDLVAAHPGLVQIQEYGQSVGGEPLLIMYLHRPGTTPKPAVWIGGNIHGNEWIGNRMVMAVAELLLDEQADPAVTAAMDELDFYLDPCVNPDGYRATWEHAQAGAITTDMLPAVRKNAHGVDLNRNWPIPGKVTIPIEWAGSPKPESINYRGPAPLSEPETAALDRFFSGHPQIVAAIEFHSTGAVMFPPHCPSHECIVRSKKMCGAFRAAQPGKKYYRAQSRFFDTYTGELEDWLYAQYGVLAMDVEISNSKQNQAACACRDYFWIFNPTDPAAWTTHDARAAIAAMRQANRDLGGARIPAGAR